MRTFTKIRNNRQVIFWLKYSFLVLAKKLGEPRTRQLFIRLGA